MLRQRNWIQERLPKFGDFYDIDDNMKLKILKMTFGSDKKIYGDASKLRGFFATKFKEHVLLHQHVTDKFVYKYPLVQYKFVNGKPIIIGINEGADVLKEIYDKYDKIRLGDAHYEIMEKTLSINNQEFGIINKICTYKFITPWFALNQSNYNKYHQSDGKEKQNLLNNILIGNILSMSKVFGYTVPEKIIANCGVKIRKSGLKGTDIMVFIGGFKANFAIPDYLGIGKSVSRGFGTVKVM